MRKTTISWTWLTPGLLHWPTIIDERQKKGESIKKIIEFAFFLSNDLDKLCKPRTLLYLLSC